MQKKEAEKNQIRKADFSKIKAVFFDLDGVLIDSYETWFYTVNDTLSHFMLRKLSKSKFASGFGNAIEKDSRTIYKGISIEEIKKMYASFFRKNWKKVVLFRQTVPVLKKLRKNGFKIALISNSSRDIVDFTLAKLRLEKYFDFTATMDDVKKSKPAPDSVLLALRKLHLKNCEAVFVGDTINDMLAGKAAKVATVGYGIKGDFRIKTLNELMAVLK